MMGIYISIHVSLPTPLQSNPYFLPTMFPWQPQILKRTTNLCDILVVSLEITLHLRGALNIYKCLMWSVGSGNSELVFQIKLQRLYFTLESPRAWLK